jgi:hypothetical protein
LAVSHKTSTLPLSRPVPSDFATILRDGFSHGMLSSE